MIPLADNCSTLSDCSFEIKIALAVVAIVLVLALFAMLGPALGLGVRAALTFVRLRQMRSRASRIDRVLDRRAARHRTTAVLRVRDRGGEVDIIGAGGRDLSPAQRAHLLPGEISAKLPGVHAEQTVMARARELGLNPQLLVTTRRFCPVCRVELEKAGATLIDDFTAVWR